jgi:dihydroflavonol-4-reductase
MKVFMSGADGILGNNLVRLLLAKGHEVKIMIETGKKARCLDNLAIERVYGSILNYEELKSAIDGQEVVIHAAAKTDTFPPQHESYWKVNVEGTRNMIKAVKEQGARRLIFVGTANSFGAGDEHAPGDETKPYAAGKYGLEYMCSKRMAQEEVLKAVQEDNLDAVVVNPTFMIGPYDSKPSSGTMILAVHKRKLPGYPPGGRNFVYVGDVAKAIIEAIDKGKRGECYILGHENLTYKEAFEKMASALGVKAPSIKMPGLITRVYGRILSFAGAVFGFAPTVNYPMALISTEKHYYSSAKAISELGLLQTPVSEALAEAVAWFRDQKTIAP